MRIFIFFEKKWVKVWWIEMFALFLHRTIFLGEAAKLSHPPADEGYFFLEICSLHLIVTLLLFLK